MIPVTILQRKLQRHLIPTSLTLPFLAMVCGSSAIILMAFIENSLVATMTITLLLSSVASLMLALEGGSFDEQLHLQRLFWLTFGFRLAIMTALHYTLKKVYGATQPYWQYGVDGGDERLFFEQSERFMQAWQNNSILSVEPYWNQQSIFAWLHILGFIRFLGNLLDGDTIFNLKMVPCMASALIVPYTYKLALHLFNRKVAWVAATLSFWLPDYWYLGSSIMRDVFIGCLIIIIFYQAFSLLFVRFQFWRLLLACGLNFLVLEYLRTNMSFVLAGTILLLNVQKLRSIKLLRILAITLIILVIAFQPQILPSIIGYGGNIYQYRSTRQVEYSLEQVSNDSLGKTIQQLPIVVRSPLAALQLCMLPFPPWGEIQNKGFIPIAIIETLAGFVWFFGLFQFLPIGFATMLSCDRTRTAWVWLPALLFILMLGATGGILIRWRLMVMPLLLLLIASGIIHRHEYRTLHFLIREYMVIVLVLYCIVKYFL